MRANMTGITLIELAVTVAIAATVATVGLPAMSDLLQRQRASTVGNRVLAELHLARTTALRQKRDVVVCPSRNQRDCDPGGDWSSGFVAQLQRRSMPAPDVVRSMPREDLHGYALHGSRSRPRLVFLRDGRAAGTNMTLSLCADGALLRQIIVSNTGRARVLTPADAGPCPDLR
jgi:type IV fimbrial biogenesis protein FimT